MFSDGKFGESFNFILEFNDFVDEQLGNRSIWSLKPEVQVNFYLRKYDRYRQNLNGIPGFSTTTRSKNVYIGYCKKSNNNQKIMTVKTGTSYIFEPNTDSIEIPMASLRFTITTMDSPNKLSTRDSDNVRQQK